MTPADLEKIRDLLLEVIQAEDPFKLYLYFVIIIVAAVSGFLSSYLGSYLQKKGENLATKEDFNELLRQAGETTKATEGIRTEIASQKALHDQIRQGQFSIATSLYAKIMQIVTNVNRLRHGHEIPNGFMSGNDIVPLTEVYEELEAKRFLIAAELHQNLFDQAGKVLEMANVTPDDSAAYDDTARKLGALRTEFGRIMRQSYGIDEILNLNRAG